MPKNTYREEFNRLTHECSAVFCFGLLAHAMGISEYHAYEVIKNAKEKDYKKAIKLYKSMMGEEENDKSAATKKKWIEQAKEEAKQNLIGEDLEKCLAALEAWGRNTTM